MSQVEEMAARECWLDRIIVLPGAQNIRQIAFVRRYFVSAEGFKDKALTVISLDGNKFLETSMPFDRVMNIILGE